MREEKKSSRIIPAAVETVNAGSSVRAEQVRHGESAEADSAAKTARFIDWRLARMIR
jgi:hypothetical protein